MSRPVRILVPLALLTALSCASKEESKPAPTAAPTAPAPAPTAAPQPDAAVPAPDAMATAPAAPAAPADPAAPQVPAAPTAGGEPPPTNLQVLPKAWSRDRVETYMKQQVSRGLGVKCRFCHDTDDFAKDTKHKKEARAMIRMVNEINADFFAGKSRVSCMTCHMGKEEPGEAE